jgi:hypothetical protein
MSTMFKSRAQRLKPEKLVRPPLEQRSEAARKLAQAHNAAVNQPTKKLSASRFKEAPKPGQGFVLVGAKRPA